jgi:hypothetical protein
MKNNLLLMALFFMPALVWAQHGSTATHHKPAKFDPWAVGFSATPEKTKLSSSAGTMMGYTLGGQIGYFFNDNMRLSTGLSYSHRGFKQSYLKLSSTVNPKGITTNINYFEIPLYFNYRTGNFHPTHHNRPIVVNKKAGFTISAGPLLGILWDGNIGSSNSVSHQIDKTDLRNAGYKNTIGFMASAGGYFQFSKELYITLEPSYKLSFTKTPNKSSYHWSSIGLNINIWYRILTSNSL